MNTLLPPPRVHDTDSREFNAPADGSSFRDFAVRLNSGENSAASELLDRFSGRLITLAQAKLSPRITTKSDPEDVVQSVLRTFFRRLDSQEVELRDWSSLWGLLSLLTIRKCAMRGRSFGTARRDVNREVPLDVAICSELSASNREPTPVEVAIFVDLLENLLVAASARDRLVIEGLIAGKSISELAHELGRTERTIYRAIERFRGLLFTMLEDAAD